MPNRLAESTSPYLRQHRNNPVDWRPWTDEAFEEAKRSDRPIFLSIGYSSCHWCHVMAHESFEDFEVASHLNRSFVSIKVDREERPDVDEAYMTAVQLQSGRGGWPLSAFLTPEKSPFFAGTYYPKASFLGLLRQVESAWATQRGSLLDSAEEFAQTLRQATTRPAPMATHRLDFSFIERSVRAMSEDFDPEHGGFGGAPKFPPHAALEFLLAVADTKGLSSDLRDDALAMAVATLEQMVLGGIHDHVGGGFHRYSTDEQWLLPHFEKMLYDNALMLGNLARAARRSPAHEVSFLQATEGIVRFLEADLSTSDGLFGSARDADSEGEEGRYYIWSVQEVRDALGNNAGEFLATYRFSENGNYLDEATNRPTGRNIPHRSSIDGEGLPHALEALRTVRSRRPAPEFDGKALVGLNGLVAASLAEAGHFDKAKSLLHRLEASCRANGSVSHQVFEGNPSGTAYLEDFAGLAWGIAKTGLGELEATLDRAEAFRDDRLGDYFATSLSHEALFGRSKPVFDQPVPSANSLMARSLLHAGRKKEAKAIVEANLGWMERAPGSTAGLLLAGLEVLAD